MSVKLKIESFALLLCSSVYAIKIRWLVYIFPWWQPKSTTVLALLVSVTLFSGLVVSRGRAKL